MKRKDEILYETLNGMQRDKVVNRICDDIKNSINNGEIIFDKHTRIEGFDYKGIKWKLNIEIIK